MNGKAIAVVGVGVMVLVAAVALYWSNRADEPAPGPAVGNGVVVGAMPAPTTKPVATPVAVEKKVVDVAVRAPSAWREYPTLSPFEGVRWRAEEGAPPDVIVAGKWYQLESLDGIPARQIVAFCKSLDERRWQKRFEEDLVEVLARMGHEPAARVSLGVREVGGGTLRTLEGVAMTEENRRRLWQARR